MGMRRLPRRYSPVWLAAAVFVLAVALWAGLFALRYSRSGDQFDVLRFELSTVVNKWLFALGSPLRADPSGDQAVVEYFALSDRSGGRAAALENVVEATIEGRLDAVLRQQGVGGRFSLPGPLAVWPPVDIELGRSPRVLVTSPRARIERLGADRLRAELTLERATALEASAEADDPSLSALVLSTGGIAFYPALVSNRNSFAAAVDTAAHEWTHHYMGFYPLGVGIPSGDRQVISETVADLVAEELAALVLARFGDPTGASARAASDSAPATAAPTSTTRRLRELRVEVDVLLSEGRIEQAEARMEQVRLELEASGVRIRRINQAYFAWTDVYAARPDAVDPLGEQLRTLRERAGSLARFMALVRDARTRDDVQRLLVAAGR
jgi:hypothetical protein